MVQRNSDISLPGMTYIITTDVFAHIVHSYKEDGHSNRFRLDALNTLLSDYIAGIYNRIPGAKISLVAIH